MALSVKNMLGGGSIGAVENLLVPIITSQVRNGLTFTNNGDGTITVSGTATTSFSQQISDTISYDIGKIKLVGSPKGLDSRCNLYMWDMDTTNPSRRIATDFGDGAIYNATSSGSCRVFVWFESGYTCDNLIFKPMLTTNLKATYKEFVKRVESIEQLYDILDCTGMVKGSITPTSDLSSLTITHNIGVVPKAVFLEIDDASIPATNTYYTSRAGYAKYYTSPYGWVVGGRGTTKDLSQTTQSAARWYSTTLEITSVNSTYPYKSGYKYNYIILY